MSTNRSEGATPTNHCGRSSLQGKRCCSDDHRACVKTTVCRVRERSEEVCRAVADLRRDRGGPWPPKLSKSYYNICKQALLQCCRQIAMAILSIHLYFWHQLLQEASAVAYRGSFCFSLTEYGMHVRMSAAHASIKCNISISIAFQQVERAVGSRNQIHFRSLNRNQIAVNGKEREDTEKEKEEEGRGSGLTRWWSCETVVRWNCDEGGVEGRNRDEGTGEELERTRKKLLEREGHAACKLPVLCDIAFEQRTWWLLDDVVAVAGEDELNCCRRRKHVID